jgi:pimeloyl-ACP methyl ester carboxylesterase
MQPRSLAPAGALAFAIVLAGCSGAGAPTAAPTAPPTPAATPSPAPTASPDPWPKVSGLFDVGGHRLYLICEGPGPTTVVYLHGMAGFNDNGKEHATLIAANLRKDVRICRYDRANVGESDTVEGKQTAANAVDDLRQLLFVAGITRPDHRSKVYLLGASFGGLVAYEYAVKNPDDVAGMVVLDPTLPREYLDIDPFYHPDDGQLTGEEWKDNKEHMDWLGSMQETQVLEGKEPKVPLIYFSLVHPSTWWHPVTQKSLDAYFAMQQRFIDLWSPGKRIIVDTPHYMEPVIPGQIADAVRQVIAEAPGT